MKKILITITALAISSTSHALVADRFKCRLEIKDFASKDSVKEEKDFFLARLPLSASPDPNVRLTASQMSETLSLDTPKAELGGNLNFYYKQAVKLDANGQPSEARQFTCIGLTGSYCQKTTDHRGTHSCPKLSIMCIEPRDPFDANKGWTPTGIIDGIPTFNEQTLIPTTENIYNNSGENVGLVKLSCQYMGSFQ
ncbi:MAG: hypothetical protein ACXVCP_11150 [Bdellovibrio sp.]